MIDYSHRFQQKFKFGKSIEKQNVTRIVVTLCWDPDSGTPYFTTTVLQQPTVICGSFQTLMLNIILTIILSGMMPDICVVYAGEPDMPKINKAFGIQINIVHKVA